MLITRTSTSFDLKRGWSVQRICRVSMMGPSHPRIHCTVLKELVPELLSWVSSRRMLWQGNVRHHYCAAPSLGCPSHGVPCSTNSMWFEDNKDTWAAVFPKVWCVGSQPHWVVLLPEVASVVRGAGASQCPFPREGIRGYLIKKPGELRLVPSVPNLRGPQNPFDVAGILLSIWARLLRGDRLALVFLRWLFSSWRIKAAEILNYSENWRQAVVC